MAPRPKRITNLGELLRAARKALGYDQAELAARCSTSARTVSRWENGVMPDADASRRILAVVARGPLDIHDALIPALGFEPVEPEEEEPAKASAPLVVAPPLPILPPPPPRPSAAELRVALDAIVLAEAETRDVLPRQLRGFGVALLKGAERLGLGAGEAAALMAAPATKGDTAP